MGDEYLYDFFREVICFGWTLETFEDDFRSFEGEELGDIKNAREIFTVAYHDMLEETIR